MGEISLDSLRKAVRLAWRALDMLKECEDLVYVGEGLQPPPFSRVLEYAERLQADLYRAEEEAHTKWRVACRPQHVQAKPLAGKVTGAGACATDRPGSTAIPGRAGGTTGEGACATDRPGSTAIPGRAGGDTGEGACATGSPGSTAIPGRAGGTTGEGACAT